MRPSVVSASKSGTISPILSMGKDLLAESAHSTLLPTPDPGSGCLRVGYRRFRPPAWQTLHKQRRRLRFRPPAGVAVQFFAPAAVFVGRNSPGYTLKQAIRRQLAGSRKRMGSGDPPGLQNQRSTASRCRGSVRLRHASATVPSPSPGSGSGFRLQAPARRYAPRSRLQNGSTSKPAPDSFALPGVGSTPTRFRHSSLPLRRARDQFREIRPPRPAAT